MTIWTAPRTDWVEGEIVDAEDMNVIGADLTLLRTPPSASVDLNESADYTTTSTAFVDINATKLSHTITTSGGDVLVTFAGSALNSHVAGANVLFDVTVDSVRAGGDDGIFMATGFANLAANISFAYWIKGLAAGSHTFRLQWKVSAGTAILWTGAGTSGGDLHPQFTVREVT
jgi:hypothetical protein